MKFFTTVGLEMKKMSQTLFGNILCRV